MNTYSMSQVETLTGIKSHTLRIWERRYNFLKPMRTETNIRFYSDHELRKLLNISILTNRGYRISKIDKMTEEELNVLIIELNSNPSGEYEEEINLLTLSMLEMKEEDFDIVFKRHVMRKGLLSTVINLIYPFLDHVGVLWTTYRTIPAQEHFISNLVRQKIISAIDGIPDTKSDARKLILFLPEREHHEIGLLLAQYIAKDLGWKVYYLGQNVPLANIRDVHDIVSVDLMMTMFVTPIREGFGVLLNNMVESMQVPLLISGSFEIEEIKNASSKIHYLANPSEFIDHLTSKS